MKYSILLFMIIGFGLQLQAQTQTHLRWVSLSQNYQSMTVHFYDGTELSGVGRVINNRDQLLFKKTGEVGVETISLYEIRKLVAQVKKQSFSFIFVQPEGYRRPLLLQQLRNGKLNVYLMERASSAGGMITVPQSATYYFLEKNSKVRGNPVIPYVQISRGFKSKAATYFEDCPELAEKIRNKEFGKVDVLEIADFYNSECQ